MNDELYDVLKDENKDNVLPDEEEQAWREADAWDHGARFRHLAKRHKDLDHWFSNHYDGTGIYNPSSIALWSIDSDKLYFRIEDGMRIDPHTNPEQFNFIRGVLGDEECTLSYHLDRGSEYDPQRIAVFVRAVVI